VPRRLPPAARSGDTPFEVIAGARPVGEATKRLLLPMSHHLENRALRIGEGSVILSAFQDAKHFTPATVKRYEVLARSSSLVAALGVGLGDEPARGVRGAQLDPSDVLAGEWSVIVLGPHFAGALVGRDLGDDDVADRERRFAFVTVYDRGLVIAAARTLLARIAPRARSGIDLG
jgi:DICT domain-containing protein